MSINTSKSYHNDFLSSFFNLPNPDRSEPFVPAGLVHAENIAAGFPDEALADHRFTARESIDAQRLALMKAYVSQGLDTGWLNSSKNPITGMAKCGYKQGFCADSEFLANKYNSLKKAQSGWRPEFWGFHTNINGSPLAMDLDYKEGEKDAVQTFFIFLENHGVNPKSLRVVYTPSGGVHVYFLSYRGYHVSRANFAPEVWGKGVDIRGNGALAVTAGSFAWTNDGAFKQYMVLNNCPLTPLPECVVEVFESHKGNKRLSVPVSETIHNLDSQSEIDSACRIVMCKQEGERNSTLNSISFAMGKLIRDGQLDENEAREKLLQAALHTGLGESESTRTIESGISAGRTSPEPYAPFIKEESIPTTKAETPTPRKIPTPAAQTVPTPRKAATPAQEKELTDEEFLKEKEFADLSYHPGFLKIFAERNGELTDERVDKIAKKVLPPKLYEVVKDMHETLKLGLTAVVQGLSTVPCLALKGARILKLGGRGNIMPANLFVNVIGDPASGKSKLGEALFQAVDERQQVNSDVFLDQYERYLEEKAEYDRKKDKSGMEKPEKPVKRCCWVNDSTIEALLQCAQGNPEGLLYYLDEGANQAALGTDRYNQNGTANSIGKLISGFQGKNVNIERKSHDNTPQSLNVKSFNVSIWTNIQTEKVAKTYTKGLEEQGYTQRFCHIFLPSKGGGETEGRVHEDYDEGNESNYEFLDAIINKILDLRRRNGTDSHKNYVKFTKEAAEVYRVWHRAMTRHCRHGALIPYIERFDEQVLRMALGFHYLHLAAHCVETDQEIMLYEDENAQRIEKKDMERAILVSDLFLASLDQFLWLLKKPSASSKRRLNREEEKFAKHVLANHEFYKEPRTAKEIIEHGYETDLDSRKLSLWLKQQGFQVIKNGSKAARQVAKFAVGDLKPWAGAIDLSRLAFTEDRRVPVAKTVYDQRDVIIASNLVIPEREFSEMLCCGEDSAALINDMLKDRRLMIDQYDGKILFRNESFDTAEKILIEEGLLMPG